MNLCSAKIVQWWRKEENEAPNGGVEWKPVSNLGCDWHSNLEPN